MCSIHVYLKDYRLCLKRGCEKVFVIVVLIMLALCVLCSCGGLVMHEGISAKARIEAQKHFEQIYAKCGASYYSKMMLAGLVEYKDVEFHVRQASLNEADKLNQVEWKGVVVAKCKFIRMYLDNERRWSDWQAENAFVNPRQSIATYAVSKQRGQWITQFVDGPVGSMKVECNQLP